MKDVYRFVKIICDDLRIKKPKITIEKIQGTTLAKYIPKNNTVAIKKDYDNKYDLCFSIAHELRHKWQIDYKVYNFNDYKNSKESLSIKEYNLQGVEIDANAYAYLIMIGVFDIEPLFNGLDDDVKHQIKKRAKEIANK